MPARHQPHIGHQLARMLEAPEVPDLRHRHHRRLRRDHLEAAQAADRLPVGRLHDQRLDLAFQLLATVQFVVQQRQVLAADDPVFRLQPPSR